ncbi:MAG: NAD-glutamate dehydrogenase [Caulobacterales bacterium]
MNDESPLAPPAPSTAAPIDAGAFLSVLGDATPEPSAGQARFLASLAQDYRADELPEVRADDFARLAAQLWAFAAAQEGREPAVRIHVATDADGRALNADLVEIVQPDAPFLVDSVMGELVEAGVSIRAMFHPIVESPGGRRSAIQVWLEPVGEERQASLMAGLKATLGDVHTAVDDFPQMVALMTRAIADLKATAPVHDLASLNEDLDFLEWLDTGHFVFLGARTYDYPRTPDGGYAAEEPLIQPEGSLGVLRDPSRTVLRRSSEPAVLSRQLRDNLAVAAPLVVAKANLKSRVHRRVYMDYVGVRRYGGDGKPAGEIRFVGLFTAQAYDETVRAVPLIRRKVDQVMARAGLAPGSHNAMRLSNILETYPRDELFQMTVDELLTNALGVSHLSDRPRVKLFIRRDPFDRFVSILFYAPRERYDGRLRERVGAMLAQAYGGHVSAYYPYFSDAPLARVHYIIGVSAEDHRDPDVAVLEQSIAAIARTWTDDLEAAARAAGVDGTLLTAWMHAFPVGYQDLYSADHGLIDAGVCDALSEPGAVAVRAYRDAEDSKLDFRLKLFRLGDPVALADVLPIVEDMGLKAMSEEGFALHPSGADAGRTVWVHEFLLRDPRGENLVFADVKQPFEDTVLAVWTGRTESDGFNRLVLELGAPWREAALIRALARYRQQSGLDPSPAVQEQALSDHSEVTRLILQLFHARFDTALEADFAVRDAKANALQDEIEEALQAVESLDADRALRRIAALVGAIQRTNYYQADASGQAKPHISFKVASRELADLPQPKPYREIYVSAPSVEAVHLRLGPVARGGLRWSDRRDDFRTEVLGLVKAQQVKNAVIVPQGSKGGFFPKRLPKAGSPDQVRAEAVAAYKTFLSGLLDITDNIDAEDRVIPPAGVVVHDPDDPYLVVAADKGTATFSDIANAVSEDYGFWLGDAFASGGSVGYDHKAMGITARGAWEGVKRHFRELGKDIQNEPFTVIGVGDMSGDVFGNGMLLSKKIRLVAAFDHRHVFIDPDPDMEASWAERKRLFDLPRSSWDDYDRSRISAGGGVFPRTAKSIALTPEAKALLDIKADEFTPAAVIAAILKGRAELMYLGGIGTYVKARGQSHLEVGDKANDAIRVNGADLRCKVVGEGANLGFTQAGRIEYAQAGGRIDTDAIDNSAGVDTSDHEVNIKILTGMLERAGKLDRPARNALLAAMTDEIAGHVLAHNHDQTLALSLMQATSANDLESYARFMSQLEAKGRLDRALEGLPDAAAIADRGKAGVGLTRPELAVLLAYGKIDLFDDTIASGAPDDPFFIQTLEKYFPTALAPYADEIRRHRLRREIIATVVCNEIVNLCGPTFPGRLRAAAGCDAGDFVIAFEAARQVLRFEDSWARVEALDGRAPAAAQTALFRELTYVLRGQTYWMARRAARGEATVQALVDAYRPAADDLKTLVPMILSPFEQKAAVRRATQWTKAGAPKDVAHSIALMRPLTLSAYLSDLARDAGWPVAPAARLYHQIGGTFGFDRLRAAAGSKVSDDPFERLAVRRLIEDMQAEQAALAALVMAYAGNPEAGDSPDAARAAISSWSALHTETVKQARGTIAEIEKDSGGWSFAKLTIANAALRELTQAG